MWPTEYIADNTRILYNKDTSLKSSRSGVSLYSPNFDFFEQKDRQKRMIDIRRRALTSIKHFMMLEISPDDISNLKKLVP